MTVHVKSFDRYRWRFFVSSAIPQLPNCVKCKRSWWLASTMSDLFEQRSWCQPYEEIHRGLEQIEAQVWIDRLHFLISGLTSVSLAFNKISRLLRFGSDWPISSVFLWDHYRLKLVCPTWDSLTSSHQTTPAELSTLEEKDEAFELLLATTRQNWTEIEHKKAQMCYISRRAIRLHGSNESWRSC